MSKTISIEQGIQGLFTLGTKVDWAQVPVDALQSIIDDKDGQTGQQFTAFLQNRGKLIIGEPKIITIDRSVAFNPAEFIGEGWKIDEQDERSVAITTLDLTKVSLVDMLKQGESAVNGEEKQKRLAKAGHICLDAGAFWHFWKNKHLIQALWKEPIGGKVRFIYFNGTVLRSPSRNRFVLYLDWSEGRWGRSCSWLGSDFYTNELSAVLAS